MKNALLAISLILCVQVNAQLPDGSTAPDFTLTDIVDSNTYNLYDYLDAGKTCFVEIFAAHCPTCWGYHQSNTLKDLYNNYGPNGTDEVMVFALEYDEYNFYEAFIGIGSPWVTAGNWLDGTPYPIFQVEGADRSVFDDYDVAFYPLVFKICPDRTTERVSTSLNAVQLYDKATACQLATIDEEVLSGTVYVDQSKNLIMEMYQELRALTVVNMQGQTVLAITNIETNTISLANLENGVYLFHFETEKGTDLIRLLVTD